MARKDGTLYRFEFKQFIVKQQFRELREQLLEQFLKLQFQLEFTKLFE